LKPRLFTLTRTIDGVQRIIGYGLVLPDGSAIAVSWPGMPALYTADSAEGIAEIRDADLTWIDDHE
jgi:hypothetical protein